MVCEVCKGSADGDRGVQNEIEGCKSSPKNANGDKRAQIQQSSPSMLSSAKRGGKATSQE